MRNYIEKYLTNLKKTKRQLRIRYMLLATLVVFASLATGFILKQNAVSLTHGLICDQAEHVHSVDKCYDVEKVLVCNENHEHTKACYQRIATLKCDKLQHEHLNMCYSEVIDTKGIEGKAYSVDQVMVVDENNNKLDEKPALYPQVQTMSVANIMTRAAGDPDPNAPSGIDLSLYESKVLLSYKKGDTMVPITDSEIVPANAEVQLEYYFGNLSKSALMATEKRAYYKIPEPFISNMKGTQLTQGTQTICDVALENGYLVFTFRDEWLSSAAGSGEIITGFFGLDFKVDPTKVTDKNMTINFTSGDKTIHFGDDWQSKIADLKVVKSRPVPVYDFNTKKAYYEYTLTVTNLTTINAPDVTVVDEITAGRTQYFDGYVGLTTTSTTLSATDPAEAPVETIDPSGRPAGSVYAGECLGANAGSAIPSASSETASPTDQSLIWKIGEMLPNETRTLTYRIKIKDSVLTNKTIKTQNHNITNAAYSFSKGEKRMNEQQSNNIISHDFQNKLKKFEKHVNIGTDNEGNFILTYRINVLADTANDFPFKDFVIRDDLFNAGDANYRTPDAIKPYTTILYGEYNLYENIYSNAGNNIPSSAVKVDPSKYSLEINQDEKYFILNLNDLLYTKDSNGDKISSYTFDYKVKIDKAAVTVCNGEFKTNNVIIGNVGGQVSDGNRLERGQCKDIVYTKKWSRKATHLSTAITESEQISFDPSDSVYASDGNEVTTDKPTGFTAPKGSYHYYVVVNEDADWDLTNATLEDQLGEHMRYIQYAKITAYEKASTQTDDNDTALDALTKVQSGTAVKSAWFNIDGKQNFSITPANLGINGQYAYVIDYYTFPYNVGTVTTIGVNNTFDVYGNVGNGGIYINPGTLMVEVSVTVVGGERFDVEKKGWYYDKPKVNDNGEILDSNGLVVPYPSINDLNLHYNDADGNITSVPSEPGVFGKIYWVIKVDGTIKAGRIIQDETKPGTQAIPMILRNDAVIGIYKGKLPEGKDIFSYNNVAEFEANSGLTKLIENTDYSTKYDGGFYHKMNITFNNDVPMEETDSMYILIATEPKEPLNFKTSLDVRSYTNFVRTAEDSTQALEDIIAQDTYNIATRDTIYKATRATYESDGSGNITVLHDNDEQDPVKPLTTLLKDPLTPGGVYVEWRMNVNWTGGVQGMVDIEDQLPEGVEPVYVNLLKMGSDYAAGTGLTIPSTHEIPELINLGYQKLETTSASGVNCIYYYDSTNNVLKWKVGPLASGGSLNTREVVFQIVCKVKDKNLLQNPNEIELINRFSAEAESNGKLYSGEAPAFITRTTLNKGVNPDYGGNEITYGNRIPFVITANEKAQDLDYTSDQLTIVDELSKFLEVDIKSIHVYNQATNEEIPTTTWSASIEETATGTQTLTFSIPDSTNVKIEYQVLYTGQSGVVTPISNIAHWDGSPSSSETKWEDQDFKFGIVGGVATSGYCQLNILKIDGSDIHTHLQGATFTVQEAEYVDGNLRVIADAPVYTGTTDANGMVTFSEVENAGSGWMKYNAIYCIKETVSPSGYICSSKPYYILNAAKININGAIDYPASIADLPEEVHIKYDTTIYEYQAPNYKGYVRLNKQFNTQGSEVLSPVDGLYRFGLYEDETPTTDPLQIIEIEYTNGTPVYRRSINGVDFTTIGAPIFRNLEVGTGKKYYIYEMDATNQPIKEGTIASINNKKFQVRYEGSNVVTIANDTVSIPQVNINNVQTYELPESGGIGNSAYYFIGTLLVLAGLFYLNVNKKCKNNA